jgi:hypothetical protein
MNCSSSRAATARRPRAGTPRADGRRGASAAGRSPPRNTWRASFFAFSLTVGGSR